MTSTFLGKWRLYIPTSWSKITLDSYVSYTPSTGKNTRPATCLWGVMRNAYPPGKETNIAFFLRDDSKLCFMLNNGKYVGGGLGFCHTLAEAIGFAFPGHDPGKLPTSFATKIQNLETNMFVFDARLDAIWYLTSGMIEQSAPGFRLSQVTPPLASVQANGKGDGVDFSWLDLTGVTLANCSLKKAQLDNCIVVGTDFSGSHLAGANLSHLDLTRVVANPIPELYTKPLQPPSADNPRTTLAGSRLNQSLVDSDWSMLDLTGATILNLSKPLSTQTKPLQVKYSILTALNQNKLSDLSLQYAVFDNAVLDTVNLNGADLTNASLIQASMHGTVLSNATLKNANMAGAQLGSLAQLFTLPAGYDEHLHAGPTVGDALRNLFAHHGITLSETAALDKQAANRVWQLNDVGNDIIYTVRLEDESSQVLNVFAPTVSATLVNAYMPDAVLTGANLYGVIASGAQLYGSKARLDGAAILEKVEFNDANLSNLNLTQANLYGANLSGALLFNVKFNKAKLSPSADHVATNLSNANLQGADFTGAELFGANLTNAAVAIKVPTKASPQQGGVYLFSLPYSGDKATLQQYTTELTAAATSFFSLTPGGDKNALQQFLTALKSNNLAPLKVAFLKHKPPITFSANAQIKLVEIDSVWQIVDGTQSYTLWTDVDEDGKTELYAASSLTNTQAGFKKRSMTLRWQASAAVDAPGQQWLLDNDSHNPQNSSTGYVKFVVKLNGAVLDVYGTALRILRMGDQNQQEFQTETCRITTLSQTNMNANTICPNGATLSVNQSGSGKSWDDAWLRAATPPRPPDCVPTDFNWCPQPAKKNE